MEPACFSWFWDSFLSFFLIKPEKKETAYITYNARSHLQKSIKSSVIIQIMKNIQIVPQEDKGKSIELFPRKRYDLK
jgi:hypothetical protein